MKLNKLGALVLAGVLVGGGLAVATIATPIADTISPPASAEAHTGNLYVEYECNPDTGLYDGAAYVDVSNTDLVGQTYWAEGTTNFAGTPTSTSNPLALTNGPVQSNGSETITLGAVSSLPGDTTRSPWVYAFTTWSDQYTQGRDGGYVKLDGDCSKVVEPEVAKVGWGYTPATCLVGQTLSVSNDNLTGAIWTEASLAKNGTAGPAEFDLVATLLEGYKWGDGQNGIFHVSLLGPDTSLCVTSGFDVSSVVNCETGKYVTTTTPWTQTGQQPKVYGTPVVTERAATNDELNDAECEAPEPPVVIPTTKTVEEQSCDSDQVKIITTVTTPVWDYVEADREYVVGEPYVVTTTTYRDKNADEAEDCVTPSAALPNTGLVRNDLTLGGGIALAVILLGAGAALFVLRKRS